MKNLNLNNIFVRSHERYQDDAEFHAEVSTAELTAKSILENEGYNLTDRDRAFIRMGAIFSLYIRDEHDLQERIDKHGD